MNIEVNGIEITLTKEQLDHIESQKEKSPEDLFKILVLDRINIHKPIIDTDDDPYSLFWIDKDGKFVCEYDWKDNVFWFDYFTVWYIITDEFGFTYEEVRKFMNEMTYKYFAMDVNTSTKTIPAWGAWWMKVVK